MVDDFDCTTELLVESRAPSLVLGARVSPQTPVGVAPQVAPRARFAVSSFDVSTVVGVARACLGAPGVGVDDPDVNAVDERVDAVGVTLEDLVAGVVAGIVGVDGLDLDLVVRGVGADPPGVDALGDGFDDRDLVIGVDPVDADVIRVDAALGDGLDCRDFVVRVDAVDADGVDGGVGGDVVVGRGVDALGVCKLLADSGASTGG